MKENKGEISLSEKHGINDEQNRIISWRAAEYEYVRKDVGWYWIIGGVSTALITIAIWQKNFFFALFIFLAAFVLIVFGKRRPHVYDFSIGEEGIRAGKNMHLAFDYIEGFSIRNRSGRLDQIVIKKKTTINPYVKIPIDSKMEPKAREYLLKKLPEIEYKESILDIISELLGF